MSGTFALNPLLIASYIGALLLDVVVPLALGVWLVRRFGLRWRVFFIGALIFFLAQIITRVPAVQFINGQILTQLQADPVLLWGWFVVLAVTAGLFEEVGRWAGYLLLFRRDPRTWSNALLYGTGHAACEAIVLIGLSVLFALINYVALSSILPTVADSVQSEPLREAWGQYNALQGWEPLLGGIERVLTLPFHISAAVLVLQCYTRRQNRWLALAIGWHTLVNFGAIATQQSTARFGYTASALLTEGWVLVMAVISLAIIYALRPQAGEAGAAVPAEPPGPLAPAGAVALADGSDVVK